MPLVFQEDRRLLLSDLVGQSQTESDKISLKRVLQEWQVFIIFALRKNDGNEKTTTARSAGTNNTLSGAARRGRGMHGGIKPV